MPLKFRQKKTVLYLFFYWPALFLLCHPLFVDTPANWKDAAEAALVTTLLLLLANFLRLYWLRLVYLLLVLLFICLTVFLKAAYLYLYKNPVSESTIFIMLETNVSEAGDFLSMYFNKQMLALSVALFLPLIAAFFFLPTLLRIYRYFFDWPIFGFARKSRIAVQTILMLFLCAGILVSSGLHRKDIFFVSYKSFTTYRKETKAYQLLGNDKLGGKFTNVTSGNDQDEIYVMVIGESTTRHHMGLYGYTRNTTPLLSAKKNELDVYTDVISPHSHTILSLQKVLTLANYEHPEAYKDGSLLQLMNKANFHTYWISNQSPIGADETLVTKLAKSAGKCYFTNTASWTGDAPYDEKLLLPLKQVLAEKAKKKFIVLHLMGTHGKYYKRYPSNFAKFQGSSATPFPRQHAFDMINQYDDAVLYNDYLLNQIIETVKQQGKKSWVCYFSDHGEDVYETINIATHQDVGGTKAMYDIPFFIWRSDKYKQGDNHQYITDRKYMTDDMIYTVADMSGVHFSEFDSTRSLVNTHFAARKSKIGKAEDYDEKYLKK